MADHAPPPEPGDVLGEPPPDSQAPPPRSPDDSSPGDSSTDGSADAPGPEPPEPVYTVLEDWLTGYFLPMFRRTLGGEYRWCHQWWQHGEAISRLTSLWHAWEVLRLQPGTGIATWYRDHLDHQLPILMGARGPFYQCSETTHREPHQADATPAPDDWWDLGDDYDTYIPVPADRDERHDDDLGAGHDGA